MKDTRSWMTPLMRSLTDRVLGPGGIPVTPAVSIGPHAIPLGDSDTYLRKVAGTALEDLVSAGKKPLTQIYVGAKNILGSAARDPEIDSLLQVMREYPGREAGVKGILIGTRGVGQIEGLIQKLSDIFHPTYLEK